MRKIKIGIVGVGQRGEQLVREVFLDMENVEIVSVCDLYQDRVEDIIKKTEDKCGYSPIGTNDYRDVVTNPEVEAVIIACSWEYHVEIAVAAMENGKAVGLEVGGGYSVADCQKLVDVWEKTRVPFMFMENCCFGRNELMCHKLAVEGKFGEIVHCAGMYGHDCRYEIANGKELRHYRLRNYLARNGENYPTHELGPLAKLLKINAGNRMMTLSSFASKAKGLSQYVKDNKSDDVELMNAEFKQGDIVTTVITCAGGETIVLTLDTSLPRNYYSRGYTVRGTKGMYEEATDSLFCDGGEHVKGNVTDETRPEFDHPMWTEFLNSGVTGGHGGMDYLEFRTFFDCLANNKPMPINVYDAAAWMVITPLSEQSIRMGGAPQEIPDFTGGRWLFEPEVKFEDLRF
ncbi:MAG: Gfo/Idh/MocA family oxidoreductase [Clostridia bacterium]|nr:Gfo/Idh/MocA family oxidoreductase [Clostridia bacterium]